MQIEKYEIITDLNLCKDLYNHYKKLYSLEALLNSENIPEKNDNIFDFSLTTLFEIALEISNRNISENILKFINHVKENFPIFKIPIVYVDYYKIFKELNKNLNDFKEIYFNIYAILDGQPKEILENANILFDNSIGNEDKITSIFYNENTNEVIIISLTKDIILNYHYYKEEYIFFAKFKEVFYEYNDKIDTIHNLYNFIFDKNDLQLFNSIIDLDFKLNKNEFLYIPH